MDFLGPSLDMTDKLIDKHFDKIPTKVFDKDTYKPKKRRQLRHQNQRRLETRYGRNPQDSDSGSGSDFEEQAPHRSSHRDRRNPRDLEDNQVGEFDDMQQDDRDIPRHSGQGQEQSYAYDAGMTRQQYDYPLGPIYSNDPPRFRPQYVPTPLPGQSYPSPLQNSRRSRNYDSDDEDYYATPARSSRRPKAVTRRSSSYPGPQNRRDDNNSYGSEGEGKQLERRRGSAMGTIDKARDASHRYGLKEEVEDVLTKSKAGLAGSAVGAVMGGWAANRAQIAYGKDKGRHEKDSNPFLTLLGAAAGGLAVDILVARYEESKKEAREKGKRWDKKWGKDGTVASESGSGNGNGKSRRRRDSYSD